MNNKEFLEDALGYIGDDLITGAKPELKNTSYKPRKNNRPFSYISAVLVLMLLVGAIFAVGFLTKEPPASPTTSTVLTPDTASPTENISSPIFLENFWEGNNFSVFALKYIKEPYITTSFNSLQIKSSSFDDISVPSFTSTDISVNLEDNIKVESIIANRYIAYYSPDGTPMFYDIKDNKEVDLEKRILGDKCIDYDDVLSYAYAAIEENLPGLTKNNKDFFETAIIDHIKHRSESVSMIYDLDLDFFKDLGEEYQNKTNDELTNIVHQEIYNAYVEIADRVYSGKSEEYEVLNKYRYIAILGIDSKNGICFYVELDLRSQTHSLGAYDIAKDCIYNINFTYPLREAVFLTDSFETNFSNDGSIITIASAQCHDMFRNAFSDILYRNIALEKNDRFIENYYGEKALAIKLIDRDGNKVGVGCGITSDELAASEIFVSPTNSIIYYKKSPIEKTSYNDFTVSQLVWYNRLDLFDKDTDIWVFGHISNEKTFNFQGKFVRFIADDTAVIMEKEGVYTAYSLIDGSDITQQAVEGTLAGIYAHENFLISLKEDGLYKINMFTGQEELIYEGAEYYYANSNNAFVFVFKKGDPTLTCINVATHEACRIIIPEEILFAIEKGSELQISFNEKEKTLLIYYSITEETKNNNDYTGIDFFETILNNKSYDITANLPSLELGTVVTEYTVSEEVMNEFRTGKAHPCGLKDYELLAINVFNKLGINIDQHDIYRDNELTSFILYEDEDEMLILCASRTWICSTGSVKNHGLNLFYVRDEVRVRSYLNSCTAVKNNLTDQN